MNVVFFTLFGRELFLPAKITPASVTANICLSFGFELFDLFVAFAVVDRVFEFYDADSFVFARFNEKVSREISGK